MTQNSTQQRTNQNIETQKKQYRHHGQSPQIPHQNSRTKPIDNLPRPQHRRHLLTPTPLLNHLRLSFAPQQPTRKIPNPRHQRCIAAAAALADETLLRDGVVGLGECGGRFIEGGGAPACGEGPGGGGGAGVVTGVD